MQALRGSKNACFFSSTSLHQRLLSFFLCVTTNPFGEPTFPVFLYGFLNNLKTSLWLLDCNLLVLIGHGSLGQNLTINRLSLNLIYQISRRSRLLMKERQYADCTQQAETENCRQQATTDLHRQTKQFIFSNPQYLKNLNALVQFWKEEKLQPTLTNTVTQSHSWVHIEICL